MCLHSCSREKESGLRSESGNKGRADHAASLPGLPYTISKEVICLGPGMLEGVDRSRV